MMAVVSLLNIPIKYLKYFKEVSAQKNAKKIRYRYKSKNYANEDMFIIDLNHSVINIYYENMMKKYKDIVQKLYTALYLNFRFVDVLSNELNTRKTFPQPLKCILPDNEYA